ncbi:MAG: ribbon-helix-helix domain-containing protein [Thermodesulfobacteriota bacterium]
MSKFPLFEISHSTVKNINMYQTAPAEESKTDSRTVKLTPTQKAALDSIVRETGYSSVSAFISDSIDFSLQFLPVMPKMLKYEKVINNLLRDLP